MTGQGEYELAALTYLALQRRELRDVERRMVLEAKARAAYVHGAEEHSRATLGRPRTQDELERVLSRFRSTR